MPVGGVHDVGELGSAWEVTTIAPLVNVVMFGVV